MFQENTVLNFLSVFVLFCNPELPLQKSFKIRMIELECNPRKFNCFYFFHILLLHACPEQETMEYLLLLGNAVKGFMARKLWYLGLINCTDFELCFTNDWKKSSQNAVERHSLSIKAKKTQREENCYMILHWDGINMNSHMDDYSLQIHSHFKCLLP